MKVSVDGSGFHAWFLAARRRSPAEEEVEQNSRGSSLTRSQWQVLTYLAQNEGINQARLAELIEIEPITLGRIVDQARGDGLIERHPHPTDRRTWLLHLMPTARPKLEQVRELGEIIRSERWLACPKTTAAPV